MCPATDAVSTGQRRCGPTRPAFGRYTAVTALASTDEASCTLVVPWQVRITMLPSVCAVFWPDLIPVTRCAR